jgi:hypothetical protein
MERRDMAGIASIVLLTAIVLSSCVQRNDYNTAPYNNNSYWHNSDSSYIYDEEFGMKDGGIWNFTDAADSAYASITDSGYQYVDYSTVKSNMIVVNTHVSTKDNFTVTTRVRSTNVMGLIFGASDTSNGYAFYIDTAGNYSLYQEGFDSVASTVVIPATQDSAYAHKDGWNILELDQTNGTWTFYINGTQVAAMSARTLSGDSFGFKVLPGTVGYTSYLKVQGYN